MYKCLECGHTFDAGEQARWTESHGEVWTGCPVCHSGYAATVRCKRCGSEQLEDDMFGGWCLECISDALTYDTALAYMASQDYGDGQNYLVDFIFEYVWDAVAPSKFGQTLRDVVRAEFKRRKFNDITCGTDVFLWKCREFILMSESGAVDEEKALTFGEWLNGGNAG